MERTRPDSLTPGFAALLKNAAREGQSLRVEIDDEPYVLSVTRASGTTAPDVWANYDADRLRTVLRRNAALPGRIDPDELDRLLDDIRSQRGQDSHGRPATP